MRVKRIFSVIGLITCLLFVATTAFAQSQAQVVGQVEEILKANLPVAGEKVKMIKVAEDDSVTFFIARIAEGAEVKSHFHKTHSESVYVIKGAGQLLIGGKFVEVKPGTVHLNSQTQVHSLKNAGSGELIILSIFTPALKEPDRHFVQ